MEGIQPPIRAPARKSFPRSSSQFSCTVPDLTRIEAWSRYMELIESGKYDEALSYSPYLQDTSRNGNHIEFLSDAAHAHAPSTVSIEPVGNVNNTYAIEGCVSFDDGTEALATTDTVLSQKDEASSPPEPGLLDNQIRAPINRRRHPHNGVHPQQLADHQPSPATHSQDHAVHPSRILTRGRHAPPRAPERREPLARPRTGPGWTG